MRLVALALLVPAAALAYHPLQVVLPRAAGTAPDPGSPALSADHFTLWAHPGIEYRMRAAVIGGHYPYTFSLSGAPAGMTVDATGEIRWPDPQANSGAITLTVRDVDGLQTTSTWSVTVDATRFRFLDCDAAGTGSGTLADPWRNIGNIPSMVAAGRILYFRACTAAGRYHVNDKPHSGGRVEFNACCWPQQWLAYPGELPVIDLGYVQGGAEPGRQIRFQGSPAAVVGFESINGQIKHFNTIEGMAYVVLWKNHMHQLAGVDGSNAAFIMTESGANVGVSHYMVLQQNELHDYGAVRGGNAGAAIKVYSLIKPLIEDNLIYQGVGTSDIEGIALKGNTTRATVRGNVVHGVQDHGIGGNQHTMTSAEILHNRVYDCGSNCVVLNQDGLIDTTIEIYRNTFVGRVLVNGVGSQPGGTFRFVDNVHVAADTLGQHFPATRYVASSVTNASQLVSMGDISRAPASSCVDANGLLSNGGADMCRTAYLGRKGAELGSGGTAGGSGGTAGGTGDTAGGTGTAGGVATAGGSATAGGRATAGGSSTGGGAETPNGCGCNAGGPGLFALLVLALRARRARASLFMLVVACSAPVTGGGAGGGSSATAGGTASAAGGTGTAGGDATAGGSGTAADAGAPLFLDRFEYDVARDAGGKFDPGSAFRNAGWSWGKDAVMNGPGSGGWLSTATSIPGFTGTFPGLGSQHVLLVESGAGTYAGVVSGTWRQTDFYLQYGDPASGPLDTIPADVWFQHWLYIADASSQPSLFPPTPRLGKWIYPTRNGYPSSDLEWLFNLTGAMIDDETLTMGSGAQLDIGHKSLASHLNLTDTDDNIFTDGRPDARGSLGYAGTAAGRLTPMTANQWWLLRLHVDHTVSPGVVEMWVRPRNGAWVKTIDTGASTRVQWTPRNRTDGHRGFRFPTTINNWYQDPSQATTHGDWWIYIDDFAIARGVHSGGGGIADLPSYP